MMLRSRARGAPEATGRTARFVPSPGGVPAIAFVSVYAVLLFCLPARLIVGPLGAPGTPANLWAIGGLVWWGVATLGGQNPVKGFTPLRVFAGLLTATVLASYANGMASGWYAPANIRQATDEFWTLVPPTADEISTVMVTAADRGLLALAGWLGIALLTADGLRSWRDLDLLASLLTWLGGFVAALGVIQFFTGLDIAGFFTIPGLKANAEFGSVFTRSVLNRSASTATHPIEFGVVVGCLLPFALHHGIQRGRSLVAWIPATLIFAGCAMSVSRTAVLVAVAAGLVLVCGWPPKWRWRALLVAPLAVIAMRVLVPGLVGTVVALFTNLFVDDSVDGRTADYGVIWHLYGEHPWLGRGLFTFVPRYYRILDNQYLMFLLELGLVGLLVVLIGYVGSTASALGAFRRAPTARDRNLGLTIAASIVGLAVSLVTFDAWSYAMATGCTFLLFGMAGAAGRLTRSDSHAETSDAAEVTS